MKLSNHPHRTEDHSASSRRSLPVSLLMVALLSMLAIESYARKSDFSMPIDVQADRSEFDEKEGVQSLIGNVEISQGTLKILADSISIRLKDNKLNTIEGQGTPIHFEQLNEAGELVIGEANSIIYDAEAGSLILLGKATLKQPRQHLESERIVFDSVTQTVSAEGGDKGRVSIRIQPPTLETDNK